MRMYKKCSQQCDVLINARKSESFHPPVDEIIDPISEHKKIQEKSAVSTPAVVDSVIIDEVVMRLLGGTDVLDEKPEVELVVTRKNVFSAHMSFLYLATIDSYFIDLQKILLGIDKKIIFDHFKISILVLDFQ